MTRAIPFAILALATLGVARAAYSFWRNGAFKPMLFWWRGARRFTRAFAVAFVLTMVLFTSGYLFADDLAFFHNVTNLWFQGHKSNVLSIAQERLAYNSNDIAGAILKMEYDLEYLNLNEISNSIIRVDNILREVHTPNLINEQERFPFFLDKILTLFTNQEMYADLEADKAKALLPEKRMAFERMLSAVCLDGLITNYPPNPQ